MPRYGVKLNSGKVLWVSAESVEVRDGAIVFFGADEKTKHRGVVAAFPLGNVDHFALPEVLSMTADAKEEPKQPSKGKE